MKLHTLLRSELLLLCLLPCFRADASVNGDLELLGEVMDWVRSNGGWISEKLEVRTIAGALSGIFTKEPLADGEMITAIPWELIMKPPSLGLGRCAKAENVRIATTKDPNEQNPYERYLAGRSQNHIPLFWSTTSKQLLSELMKDFHTNGFENDLTEMVLDECGTTKDEKHIQAMMLLHTRGEGERIDLLVPFGDLMNHRVSAPKWQLLKKKQFGKCMRLTARMVHSLSFLYIRMVTTQTRFRRLNMDMVIGL